MKIYQIQVGEALINCYLLVSEETHEAVIIDPGANPQKILKNCTDTQAKPVAMFATHGEFDQIGAASAIQEQLNIPLYIHQDDVKLLKSVSAISHYTSGGLNTQKPPQNLSTFSTKQAFKLSTNTIEFVPTPGHTAGSTSFYLESGKTIFVGDALENTGKKLTVNLNLALKTLQGVKTILDYSPETIIYQSHQPVTKVSTERKKWENTFDY